MAKKVLVTLTIILIMMTLFIVCRNAEVREQSQWTKRSENLLNVRKYPKKPLKTNNLFEE